MADLSRSYALNVLDKEIARLFRHIEGLDESVAQIRAEQDQAKELQALLNRERDFIASALAAAPRASEEAGHG